MIKDLLVHVEATGAGKARLELAISLAKRHGAHLKGLHALSRGFYQSGQENMVRGAEAAADLFARCTGQHGRDLSAEWCQIGYTIPGANITEAMLRHGRCSDLMIVGQPDEEGASGTPSDLSKRLVLTAGRPVLVVPYAGQFSSAGERILVAVTAGRESMRAVHDALPLLQKAKSVLLLEVASGGNKGPDLCPDLRDHLRRHGVKLAIDRQAAAGVPVADVLLNRAFGEGFDLLVMGAYAPPSPRSVAFGPVAEQILRQMTLPVLMAH